MIYCSQCGTANKPNSKFCKNCAAPLAPSTDVRCPICGTMNPQDATTCSNCGSRLLTNAAGSPALDNTTPADAPETIAPFNPPDVAPEPEAPPPAPAAPTHSANRPTFGRANSEWLRRIRKTPPSVPTAETLDATDDQPTPMDPAQTSAPVTAPTVEQPAAPEPGIAMVEEIAPTAETKAPTAEHAATPAPVMETESAASVAQTPLASLSADPAPTLDAASPSDISAETSQVVTMQESAPAVVPSAQSASLEPPVQPASQPEMKLTGDSYDYSDVGGHVTEEMRATLSAHADKIESVEDEVALARRLLGLDVETTAETPVSETRRAETISAEPTTPSIALAPMVQTPIAEITAPAEAVAQVDATAAMPTEEKQEKDSEWLAALAATSSTAVAAQVADQAKTEAATDEIAVAPTAEVIAPPVAAESMPTTPEGTPPTAEPAPTAEEVPTPPADAPTAEAVTPPAAAEPPTEAVATPPVAPVGTIPDWVRELAPREVASPEKETADEVAEPKSEGAMPAWVQGLAPNPEPAGASALLERLPELDEQEREELPDWLREPVVPPTEPEIAVPSEEVTENEEPELPLVEPAPMPVGTFELPSWFTSGAPPPSPLPADPFETIETTGPLAGVSGILPLAVAIAEPHTLIPVTPTKSDGGRVFQTILAEPLAPAAHAPAEVTSKPLFTRNHLLYLLIFLAALVPMFLPLNQAGLGLNTSSGPSADFYSQLQAVPAGGTVLVAFDYTPGQGVELDPAAGVLVNDLAAQHVNVVALSTNPYGAALAQNILGQAQAAQPTFTFVNLGFLYGNEAGLKNLALGWLPANRADVNGMPWGASPLAQNIHSFDDLALSVIIAGDSADLRAWMEQVQPNVKSPIVAATTAVLEPQARNYVNARQLHASLRGLTGAAELELSSNRTGPIVKTVDALSFVSLLLAGIIVIANVAWLVRRK